jgi:hypothetical protein
MSIVLLLLCGVAMARQPETNPQEISKSIRADIRRMWETVPMGGERTRKASSFRATEAAYRVFTSIQFVGMTRQEVIHLVGDPQKSSDSIYNFPFYPTPKDMLVYRFDTGTGGWQFNFSFDRHGRVSKVTSLAIG